ncbi:MAG: tRNA (adenosine(37)-N6)-dimethylallyltransferase MiaA [Mogibacterium diversum]|jgi:tRNA dimethylallyltransferase|uniref:tRNA (adenosine(37)-N6)-dimethylallyltransferase MiaA n=2 Tax=Mogibacterium TaxID=86331 RepID=UPI00179A3BF9|nr:tRNA (adenosine(37)-N6)-dimethylallyltransferase MiaA [Mogibacterium sp.]MBB1533880.1 tRNA (adenosine(37)-N6)-dimethylallyltransferase MiaA [Mogibacterium sp.]MBF1358220.1 tRNA (adenosine(37)-N6)-dimethylallyltransferase MiaA [Mogibacterium diversum]
MTIGNKKVYIIGGPTAAGKSIVALYLAKRVKGEIVNCDSVQLYKYMDIGSAKPSQKDMKAIPHHLYGFVDPADDITVAQYQKLAFEKIDEILARGNTPIVVGGTGLYLNSLIYKMSFAAKPINLKRRDELEHLAEVRGNEYLFELLSAVDPDAAARIHPNNIRKIIRAIEAYELGSKLESMDKLEPNTKYDFKINIVNMEREWLYTRINRRVDKLMEEGLLKEVKHLLSMGYNSETPAMKGIGYKELLLYLDGKATLEEAVNNIKTNTRHYAKRQLTWFKRYKNAHWIEIQKGQMVGNVVDEILEASK